MVVLGTLPLIEGPFGYLTDVRLLELANLNHPALKELIVHAPGTYHHSIVMGAMVEAAAEAIGANPLLARVGAYYHDLGKIRNPPWFAENQRGENRHDELAPSMSALVIKRHVADGVELAQRWRLPRAGGGRHRAAPRHAPRRLLLGAWSSARRRSGSARRRRWTRRVFRYAGPRPQTREAALVMIADSCEASARAMEAPTAAEFASLVTRRVNEIFAEGQLDECDLTLQGPERDRGRHGARARGRLPYPPGLPPWRHRVAARVRPPVQLVARK